MRYLSLLLLSLPALAQLLPGVLVRELNLTPQQQQQLVAISSQLADAESEASAQSAALNAKIHDLRTQDPLDPAAIGLAYVDLETICRAGAARHDKAMLDARALLTPPQSTRLAVLEQASTLGLAVAYADQFNLIDAPASFSPSPRTYPGCASVSPSFEIPDSLPFASRSNLAQPKPQIDLPTSPLDTLSTYLALSSSQTAKLQSSTSELTTWLFGKALRASRVHDEILIERRRDLPQPLPIGIRYAELESICRDAKDHIAAHRRDFRSALTPPQLQKVAALEQATALLPTVNTASQFYLVDPASPGAGIGISLGLIGSLSGLSGSLPGCEAPPSIVFALAPLSIPAPPAAR